MYLELWMLRVERLVYLHHFSAGGTTLFDYANIHSGKFTMTNVLFCLVFLKRERKVPRAEEQNNSQHRTEAKAAKCDATRRAERIASPVWIKAVIAHHTGRIN